MSLADFFKERSGQKDKARFWWLMTNVMVGVQLGCRVQQNMKTRTCSAAGSVVAAADVPGLVSPVGAGASAPLRRIRSILAESTRPFVAALRMIPSRSWKIFQNLEMQTQPIHQMFCFCDNSSLPGPSLTLQNLLPWVHFVFCWVGNNDTWQHTPL